MTLKTKLKPVTQAAISKIKHFNTTRFKDSLRWCLNAKGWYCKNLQVFSVVKPQRHYENRQLCAYSRIPAVHSTQWLLAVSRFQAALVGVGWRHDQGKVRVLQSEPRLSWPCAKWPSNRCYTTLDSSSVRFWISFCLLPVQIPFTAAKVSQSYIQLLGLLWHKKIYTPNKQINK